MMRYRFKATGAALALALAAVAPGVGIAQNIGVVADVTPQMSGTPPGQGSRVLGTGNQIFSQERIETGRDGRGQLLFLDESVLTVASSSSVVLDRFVYDPDRGAGEIGLSITRGALRFIGGAASDAQPAQIVTPNGTIGIRGSSVMVLVEDDGTTLAIFISGDQLCFSVLGGSSSCTSRAGGMLTEDGYQGQVTPEFLAQVMARLDGAVPTQLAGGSPANTGAQDLDPSAGPVSTRGQQFDSGANDPDLGTQILGDILPQNPVSSGVSSGQPPVDSGGGDDSDQGGGDDPGQGSGTGSLPGGGFPTGGLPGFGGVPTNPENTGGT